MADRADKRLYSSGCKFKGWVFGSILLRRDDDEELPNERELRDLADAVYGGGGAESFCAGEAGRTGFLPTGFA